jgi:hypothetical protein
MRIPKASEFCAMITVADKDKRPNMVRPLGDIKNRDALNEAHMPFDFFFLPVFFFVAITLLLAFDAPYPLKILVHYK